jgi:transposase InsO family protein
MGSEHGSLTPDGTCTSNIEGGLVFGGRSGKLRDELLNGEKFDTVLEAQVLVENWRRHYNAVRPHSSLGYRPPAPEAVQPWPSGSAALRLQAMVTLT